MNFNIGARIEQLRSEKKMSANKLATSAGLSQSYVRKLELNESAPTVESLELICNALGITLSDFFSHSDATLVQLEVIGMLKELSDSQLKGLCELLKPYNEKRNN